VELNIKNTVFRIHCIKVYREAVFLRDCQNISIGAVAIIVGIFIILAIVLPAEFWWFILALSLICYGIRAKRRK